MSIKQLKGFTLIEILVALVVLSIGLLGIAGLQLTSMKNNQGALFRTQASVLMYDMADRIRINKSSMASYNGIDTEASSYSVNTNCMTTTGCNSAALVTHDAAEWEASLTNALPVGVGTVAVAAGMFTVTVMWDEFKNGSTTCAAGIPNTNTERMCISFTFQPQ